MQKNAAAYRCDLGATQVLVEVRGDTTHVTVATLGAGQQQSQQTGIATGPWIAPPTLARTGLAGGLLLRIEGAKGPTFVRIAAGGMAVLAAPPSDLGEAVPLEPREPREPAPAPRLAPFAPVDPLPPLAPLEPLRMGDMEMRMEPMAMRMGDMEMRMGSPAATPASRAPPPAAKPAGPAKGPASPARPAATARRFCTQCGAPAESADRFCGKCGHELRT